MLHDKRPSSMSTECVTNLNWTMLSIPQNDPDLASVRLPLIRISEGRTTRPAFSWQRHRLEIDCLVRCRRLRKRYPVRRWWKCIENRCNYVEEWILEPKFLSALMVMTIFVFYYLRWWWQRENVNSREEKAACFNDTTSTSVFLRFFNERIRGVTVGTMLIRATLFDSDGDF